MREDLADAAAVAEMLGLAHAESVSGWRTRPGFPDPVRTRPNRWFRTDIDDYLARTGRNVTKALLDLGAPPSDARRIVDLMRDDGIVDFEAAYDDVRARWRERREVEQVP